MTDQDERALLRHCNFSMACVALGPVLTPAFLTSFADAFSIDNTEQLGRIAATLFVGSTLGIAVTGPLADRIGARPFAVGGAAAIAIGLLAMPFAPAYGFLLLATFITGLGAGTLDMILSPIVSAATKNDGTRALNGLHACYALGAVTWLAIAAASFWWGVPWRATLSCAAIPAGYAAVRFLFLPSPPLIADTAARMPLRALVRMPSFLILLVAITLAGAAEEGMAQWLPAYSERELGFSKAVGGAALACFALGMGMGTSHRRIHTEHHLSTHHSFSHWGLYARGCMSLVHALRLRGSHWSVALALELPAAPCGQRF